MTVSMVDPVSISAVAKIVSEPPFSMLRAAPRNRFGGHSAVESTPPDRMRPEAGGARVYPPPRGGVGAGRATPAGPRSTRGLGRPVDHPAAGGGVGRGGGEG